MTIFEKEGYLFLSGMFWQTPDEGKRSVNFSKLIKDTGNTMYCRTKKILPTWGFCHKEILPKGKKVASLGQFIVECSNVDERTPNSIIAYKFKNKDDVIKSDTNEVAKEDLFGYIVFMNGTICPDDGEFISDILSLRINILKKLRKYEIKRLDLPLDAAESLFNIWERLTIAYSTPDIIYMLVVNAANEDKRLLTNFIEKTPGLEKYNSLISFIGNEFQNTDELSPEKMVELVRQLTREPTFIHKRQNSREEKDDLFVLPEKINIAPLISEQIYWQNKNFKSNFNKSMIKTMSSVQGDRIKLIGGFLVLGIAGYFAFIYKSGDELPLVPKPAPKPIVKLAVDPQQLIKTCLKPNDKYFTDLGHWTLTGMKCNSLNYTLTFLSNTDTTLTDFIALTGDKNALLNGKVGTIERKYQLTPISSVKKQSRQITVSNLQNMSIQYGVKLQLPNNNKDNKFIITSKLSPIYLVNHGVLNNVRVTDLDMSFEQQSGYYNWTIKGEL